MNKIIQTMKFLDLRKYEYNGHCCKVIVNVDGTFQINTWDESYHNGNIENYEKKIKPIDELDQYLEKKILDELKFLVENKIKNKALGFDLY